MNRDPAARWSRSRLVALLGAALATLFVLVAALGYAVVRLMGETDSTGRDDRDTVDVEIHGITDGGQASHVTRDNIAAAPMPTFEMDAAFPRDPQRSDIPSPVIEVPRGDVPGPAAVLTGFPRTPEGAIGQLAAIESSVFRDVSPASVAAVHNGWAMPGGPGASSWPLAADVRAFLGGVDRGNPAGSTRALTVAVQPAGAMVKGSDGPGWTVACVLMTVTASLERELQVAYGYCERMQWAGGRWMIAPGVPPAPAPSTWPGSAEAVGAGWNGWTTVSSPSVGGDDR